MRLRKTTRDDLALVQHWDEQAHVKAAGVDDDWDWENQLGRSVPWREMLIAELDDRPIGFIQIIDPAEEESHYWGACAPNLRAMDIWIGEESDLGKGYGAEMMQLAFARCFAPPGVTAILIDPLAANTRAHHFYERLGFKFMEQRQFDEDSDCHIYKLDRADWRNGET